LADATLGKWLYYQKQTILIGSMHAYQNPKEIEKTNPKIHMETEKISKNQNNSDQKVQC
jgi:hypothetical protein